MAKIFGEEKKVAFDRSLYVGVARIIPLVFNPTKEELSIATKGVKSFENDPKYKFELQDGDSYKFDIWCKLEYVVGEDGTLVQPDIETVTTDPNIITDYVSLSWWGRNKPDIVYNKEDNTVKGAWYVSPVTCQMEWVPENNIDKFLNNKKNTRLDYTSSKTYIGTQGEKELYTFLERWLMIKEIDFATPFLQVIRGNYKEINDALKANLNRTDRSPRGIKVLLGIRETEDAAYQSVYPRVIMAENNMNYNKFRDALDKYAWTDDKSNGNFTLRKYVREDMPSENTTVKNTKPSQASW